RLWRTANEVKRFPTMRKIGNLRIALTDGTTPFAFRLFRQAHVLLPESMVAQSEDLTIALKHEAQHHRHGDTRWVHVQELLGGWFFWNPVVRRGLRQWHDVQEWACDEALIGRERVCIESYARCLIEVAENAL